MSRAVARALGLAGQNKYRNERTRGYASGAEADRGQELRLLAAASVIFDLVEQPKFDVAPAGCPPVHLVLDYGYRRNEFTVCEDVKGGDGTITPLWRLKAKLFCAKFPALTLVVARRYGRSRSALSSFILHRVVAGRIEKTPWVP